MPRVISKSAGVRIKKYSSFGLSLLSEQGRGWRVERRDGSGWKLIGYRGTFESATDLADQACVVLDTTYEVVD